MRQVERNEIVDYMTYEDRRDEVRETIFQIKAHRRFHVGPHLTFLFENRDTIRYQVQEMVRAERMVREADIVHELKTYNELLGKEGQLGCTLLIEIRDAEGRQEKLSRWLKLNGSLYLKLEDGEKVRASWDPRQVGDDRLSSVQYLIFDTKGRVPVAVGCDFDEADVFGEYIFTPRQTEAIAADLGS